MVKLEKILKNTVLYGGILFGTALFSLEVMGQYNVNIHARSLDKTANGTPISGMVVSKDGGDVVEVTNANGDALMSNVGGQMSIKISHPSYKQFTQTFNITKDTTLYLATPALNDSRWPGDILDVDKYKALFQTANGDHDPRIWRNFPNKINIQFKNATSSDSAKATAFFTQLKNMTGYDMFNVTTGSTDTMYTAYFNSNTFVSAISTDANRIIFNGFSKFMNLPYTKYFGHEVLQAEDISSMIEPAKYPSIGDPDIATMTDLNQTDAHHIGVTFDQHFRKYSGKQILFLGNMQNYVALGNVSSTLISNPANNSTGNDTIVNILFNKDSNAIYYDYKITTDAAGNTILLQGTLDRPKVTADLEPNKDYYVFARARNTTSTGTWTSNKFKTKAAPTVNITSPTPGATVPTKFTSTWTGGTAPYRMQVLDANSLIVKDSSNINVQSATFDVVRGHRGYTLKVKASDTDWTTEQINTANNSPTAATYTSPTNNSTLNSSNYINGKLKIIDSAKRLDQDLDTQTNTFAITGPGVNWSTTTSHDGLETLLLDSAMFQPNTQYTATITTSDGYITVSGNTIKFTTPAVVIVNYPPTKPVTVTPEASSTKDPRQAITFKWRKSTDQNGDAITYKGHVWNSTIDTTINNVTDTLFVMAANKLKNNQTFNYTITASDGKLESTSNTVSFNTSLPKPGNTNMTNPLDGATEIPQQTPISSTQATNAESYEYRIFQGTTLVKDSTVATPNMTYNLPGNRVFTFMARAKNSSQNGDWSSTVTAKTYNDAPTITSDGPSSTDKIDPRNDLTFIAIAYDKNNDPIAGSLEIKNNEQDTIINNLTPDNTGKINYILKKESNFLKPQKTYNYIFTASDGTKSSTATGQFSTLGTGIENLVDKSGIKIYPTIGSEYINIECNPIKPVTYNTEIFDMSGRLVYHDNDKIYGTEIKDRIDVSSLKNGMYLLIVTLDNEAKEQKIIVN